MLEAVCKRKAEIAPAEEALSELETLRGTECTRRRASEPVNVVIPCGVEHKYGKNSALSVNMRAAATTMPLLLRYAIKCPLVIA